MSVMLANLIPAACFLGLWTGVPLWKVLTDRSWSGRPE
jgi:hypothetical protein